MKDKVFIAWSGDNEIAAKVGKKLKENDFGYYVGGDKENNVKSITVGEAIIKQIEECNQAIIIFNNDNRIINNKGENQVGGNLVFELGYALSAYKNAKIHCVKRKGVKLGLPSDIENAFIREIDAVDDDAFVKEIVDYFLKRQKMTIDTNKMYLINNRHIIQEMIKRHYSSDGSKCSNYELAQYTLIYTQAAHMFHDEKVALQELKKFYQDYGNNFSDDELGISVRFCIGYLEMLGNLRKNEKSNEVFIDFDTFDAFSSVFEATEKEWKQKDDIGNYYIWLRAFAYEIYNFALMLMAENITEKETDRIDCFIDALDYANKALKELDLLEEIDKENGIGDTIGIIALFRSYLFRNQFVVLRDLAKLKNSSELAVQSKEWLNRALDIRKKMMETFKGVLDTNLYNEICMEYYLISVECLYYLRDSLSKQVKRRLKEGTEKFLESVKQKKDELNFYISQIKELYSIIEQEE